MFPKPKQVINVLFTLAIFGMMAFLLFHWSYLIMVHTAIAQSDDAHGVFESCLMEMSFLIDGLVFCILFLGGVITCLLLLILTIIYGEGIIWRQVNPGDSLREKVSGKQYRVFKKQEHIFRFNPLFWHMTLYRPGNF